MISRFFCLSVGQRSIRLTNRPADLRCFSVSPSKLLSVSAVFLSFATLAGAQVGGTGGTTLTCSVNTFITPTLRSEGITEQIGDIVITCTGGDIADGTAGSQVNITVSLGSQVTSRLIPAASTNASNVSEALLLIDEPTTGLQPAVPGYGSNAPFIVCPNPGPTTATNP